MYQCSQIFRSAARTIARVCIAVLLCALPTGAVAQTSMPDLPTMSYLETALSAAPRPGQSGVSLTIGGQVEDGATETRGLSITGVAAHTTDRHQLLRVDFTNSYAKYRSATTGPSVLAKDNQLASFTFEEKLKTRYAVLAKAGWRRDQVLGLDYRWFIEGGAGLEVYANAKVNAFVGASYAVGKEQRPFTTQGSDVLDAGVLQSFNAIITNVLSFHEWFEGRVQTNDTSDHSYSFSAALRMGVSRYAGLEITYARQDDSLHLPYVPEAGTKVVVGLQVSFPPARPKT